MTTDDLRLPKLTLTVQERIHTFAEAHRAAEGAGEYASTAEHRAAIVETDSAYVNLIVALREWGRSLVQSAEARASAAEQRLREVEGALDRHVYEVLCEGVGAQSFRCKECTVRVHAKRPGPRPSPFPHAAGCILSSDTAEPASASGTGNAGALASSGGKP